MAWTKIEFLETGNAFYQAVLEDINKADQSVLIEKYIFRCDRIGRDILSALGIARKRGVRVYLRVDGMGSREEIETLSEICKKSNIELEVFHPLPFASGSYHAASLARFDSLLMRWKMINRRTHRKLIIVDEKVAFTGGRNVDDVESEQFSRSSAWHDLSLRLEGASLPILVKAFWLKPFGHQPSRDFLLNYNWRLRLTRNRWFYRHLKRSKRRFWVVTPYFAPLPTLLFQLKLAARRGVDIRLVLPNKIDIPLSRMAARALYHQLLSWGVRIYEYEPKILHRKLWVIDNLALVGSGNLNHRSFIHDLELDVILRSAEAERCSQLFLGDQILSREIFKNDLKKLSLWKRVLYWGASWLVYWL